MEEENKQQKKKKIPTILTILIFIGCFILGMIISYFTITLPNFMKCQDNMFQINDICKIYATKNEGKYPNNLHQLQQNEYIKEIPKCPQNNCEYKFVSKYIKNGDKEIKFFIIHCPKHNSILRSPGYWLSEGKHNSDIEKQFIDSIKQGKIPILKDGETIILNVKDKEAQIITLTDEELKQLGFK